MDATIDAKAATLSSDYGARHVRFQIALPGFDSLAELMLPSHKLWGAAVLVHGSDVEDQDGTTVFRGQVVSRPLKRIAEVLACKGLATVRYNKRYVTGPTSVNRLAFDKLTLQDFAADAEQALEAKARTELAHAPIFLVGWSEGTTVVAEVAARRRDLAGVIFISPVTTSFATTLQRQWPATARPYVARYAKNGVIDAEGVAAAAEGPGGLLAQVLSAKH